MPASKRGIRFRGLTVSLKRHTGAKNPGAKPDAKKKDRVCTRSLKNKLEPKLPERCRYCFGGAGFGGVLAGVVGLVVAGFTALGAALVVAGAGTPDWTL